jgi:uncharacterized protein YukE
MNNLHYHVDALVQNDTAFEALKNRYSDMLADITSARTNPTCSCRGRLGKYLQEKFEGDQADKDFIALLLKLPGVAEKVEETDKAIEAAEKARNEQKMFHVISKGGDSWNAFVQYLRSQNIQYTSFSVVEKETQLEVYLA